MKVHCFWFKQTMVRQRRIMPLNLNLCQYKPTELLMEFSKLSQTYAALDTVRDMLCGPA